MPTSPNSYKPASGEVTSSAVAENRGDNPQQVQVSFSFRQHMQGSMTWGKNFTGSDNSKATVALGLPFWDESGKLAFTAAQNMSVQITATAEYDLSINFATKPVRARPACAWRSPAGRAQPGQAGRGRLCALRLSLSARHGVD